MVKPAALRQAARYAQRLFGLSQRRAGKILSISNASLRYHSRREDYSSVRQRLKALAAERPRFGYRRLGVMMKGEGLQINHKRVYCLYIEERLVLRRRRRQRATSATRAPMSSPSKAGERYSMDFMSDSLASGRVFRSLNIVNDYTRACLAIEVDTSLSGERAMRVLDRLVESGRRPKVIVVDNGSEFTSRAVDAWAIRNKVHLHFIDPGRPMQNAYIESFNGRMRDECLNQQWFVDLDQARRLIEEWRVDYNQKRPHSSLGHQTPEEFLLSCAGIEAERSQVRFSL